MPKIAAFAALALFLAISATVSAWTGEAEEEIDAANVEIVRLTKAGKYAEGTALALRTLERAEMALGPDAPRTLSSFVNLAELYKAQGRYGEAEPLFKRALEGFERVRGKEHPDTLTSVNNLAGLYYAQGRYGEAGPFFERALEARERVLGKDDPRTLTSANNLGLLYADQGRYGEAELLYKRALEARERVLGKEHPDTLNSVNNLAMLYGKAQGRYGEAEPLFKRALETQERVLGKEHPDTLNSVNNLAGLYEAQGRYGEAEPHYKRALEARERQLGREHPDTLVSVNNLAHLYEAQGQYGEAEPLYNRALDTSERVLGREHPRTLISVDNLAGLYKAQGRYGEAERLYKRALEARERVVLGKEHPDTLTSIANLAGLYDDQDRYHEAEPLHERALEASERVLGKEHPETLISVNNLAQLYYAQGRYGEAEPLLKRALETSERVLGKEHPNTLISLNSLAMLYKDQGHYGEAEPLFKRALETRERILGKEHPHTLTSVNNLALHYKAQGRYSEAEPLYKRALETSERVLGREHPRTLASVGNLAVLLTATGKTDEALRAFRTLNTRLSFWLYSETDSTEGAAVRRKILTNSSGEQGGMLSFALRHPSEASTRFAVDVMMGWKKRLLQDDAYFANLMRTSRDPRIIEAAKAVREAKQTLANAALNPKVPQAKKEMLKQTLDTVEAELRRQSPGYQQHNRVNHATTQDVQDALPRDGVLVEYRLFRPFNFETGKHSKLHMLAAVLRPSAAPVLANLGEAEPILKSQRALIDAKLRQKDGVDLIGLRRLAYRQLIAPLKEHLAGAKTLFLAPDGLLHALPFDILLDENDEVLLDIYGVHMVQTGRDLVARSRVATAKGLVAFGGIDYGSAEAGPTPEPVSVNMQSAQADMSRDAVRSLEVMRGECKSFKPLAHSGAEVDEIAALYARRRDDEPEPVVYKGRKATEIRLKALAVSPRVLHLATHGCYLPSGSVSGQPLLQSGVAMAGANGGLEGESGVEGEDGILHAIEVPGLNLYGTELVVLSACQTGRGVYDYSEGLEGLPSAFYLAGAKNVLVALWNADDEGTKAFMTVFYDRWTQQANSDPAAALRETKKYFKCAGDRDRGFQCHLNPKWRDPQIWAPFVIFEG